jgi:choline kinase
MAGEGSRFKKVGFSQPKHRLVVKGKSIFTWALSSMKNFFNENFVFVTQLSNDDKTFIAQQCQSLGIKNFTVKMIDHLTDGQSTTVVEAEELIVDPKEEIMIYNIDTYVEPDQLRSEWIKGAGWVPCFKAKGDKWSFVKFDEDLKVYEITEKIRISEYGTIGLYYFESYLLFKECYDHFQYNNNQEKYIAPLYSYVTNTLQSNVYTHVVNEKAVHVLGTPEDVASFWPEFLNQKAG